MQLDSDLSFKVHIEKTVAAASKLAGWGLRSFKRRSRVVMKTIWKTLVQPKMDYCSQLWSPGDQDSINKLEAIQRHFTSKVKGLEEMDYLERLQDLKLLSQERRRERYMVIFLWKISQGMVGGYNVMKEEGEQFFLTKWLLVPQLRSEEQGSALLELKGPGSLTFSLPTSGLWTQPMWTTSKVNLMSSSA